MDTVNQKQQTSQATKNSSTIKMVQPQIDYLFDENNERACIGAVLTHPGHFDKINRIVDGGEAFFSLTHRTLWDVIKYLADNKMDIDTVTVSTRLQLLGKIKEIPPNLLTQMIRETPSSVHAETYARSVQEYHSKRQMLSLASDIKAAVETEPSIERIAAKIQSRIDKTMDSVSKRIIMTMADYNHDQLDASEKARKSGEVVTSIKTGIPGMDNILDGLFPGTYVLGARTHDGKTITLSTIAINAAIAGKKVLFVNTADGDDQTVLATLQGMECGLPPQMILRKTWNDKQYQTYLDMLSRTSKWNMFIKHKLQMTPRELWTEAKIISRTYGLDMIVVDYIQRMSVPSDVKVRDERQKMIYISAAMNEIKKEFNVPVLYGAQLLVMGEDVQPLIAHTQESKNIIQDVDVAMTIWHKQRNVPELTINIEKNKINHTKGTFLAGFSTTTGRVAHKGYNNGLYNVNANDSTCNDWERMEQ